MEHAKKIGKILIFILVFILGYVYFNREALIRKYFPIAYKPVIYVYPLTEQKVVIKLNYQGELTCTYPDYKEGWNVWAKPDGTLLDLDDNRTYSYLFWEGRAAYKWDLSEGFVVKGEDTEEFFRNKLTELGLKPEEYNEFIVYWLPQMQNNKYNLIHFAGKEYEKLAALDVTPKPDSLLRVFMVYKPLKAPVKIKPQVIKPYQRKGFTVVEWGGTRVD